MKANLILFGVFSHFFLGLCTFLPTPSAPRQWPFFGAALDLYQDLEFAQTWRMFAPPARDLQEIAVAYRLPGGWTELSKFNDTLKEQVQGQSLLAPLPRGYIRLANHFRAPQLRGKSLEEQPSIKFFYHQLSRYLCQSQGRPEGLEAVRFYHVVTGIEPFYPTDEDGQRLPTAAERTYTQAIYERECSGP